MRFLVVIVTAVLVSAGSVSAQPRFAVQEPEPARLSEREQRAEDLEDVGLALLITGVGFWALETHHPRELCGPPRPTGQMRGRDARDLHVGHRRGVVGRRGGVRLEAVAVARFVGRRRRACRVQRRLVTYLVSKEYVEAVALQTEQAEASALGHRDFRWAGCCTAMGADGASARGAPATTAQDHSVWRFSISRYNTCKASS